MLLASENLKVYIESQITVKGLAKRLGVDHTYLYKVLSGHPISQNLGEKLLRETGFGFDQAFIILPEKKEKVKK